MMAVVERAVHAFLVQPVSLVPVWLIARLIAGGKSAVPMAVVGRVGFVQRVKLVPKVDCARSIVCRIASGRSVGTMVAAHCVESVRMEKFVSPEGVRSAIALQIVPVRSVAPMVVVVYAVHVNLAGSAKTEPATILASLNARIRNVARTAVGDRVEPASRVTVVI